MDRASVTEATRAQQTQFLTAEALQAALAVLAPSVPVAAALGVNATVAQHSGQAVPYQSEQSNLVKQQAKRKGARTIDDGAGLGPPRPPPIKHEVYEDLEERFQQLQSEREPKRHRGNPKGYQIKSFCKNPACGKQLNGGRTNRCEHCGYDLASHRRNAQLERLIKSGPLAHTQVRTVLRDAANEVHVRTGGKAMVLTLVYIEGAPSAPAQAIAYGKPAAAFVESRKELITDFEAACVEHFRTPEQAPEPGGQQQPQSQPAAPLLPPGALPPGTAAAALRPGSSLGPGSHLLATAGTAAGANGGLQATAISAGSPGLTHGSALSIVDLDAVIAAAVADPFTASARCREARLSGEVLARLPQAMQLTVLMQAGLLAGEAASVVVELEARMRPAALLGCSPAQAAVPPLPNVMALSAAQVHSLGAPVAVHHLLQPGQHVGLGLMGAAGTSTAGAPGDTVAAALHSAAGFAHGGAPAGALQGGPLPVEVHGPGEPLLGPLQAALMAAAAVNAGSEGLQDAAAAAAGVVQLQGALAAAHTAAMSAGLGGFGTSDLQPPAPAQHPT